MLRKVWVSALMLVMVLVPTAYGRRSTPSRTVRSMLLYEQRHDNVRDTLLNRRNLNIYRRWITPSLYRLLLRELVREELESQLYPDDKPYFGDGMQFGYRKELCQKDGVQYNQQFSVKKARLARRSAIVPASFFYNKACDGGDPVVFQFKLVRVRGRWLIDDLDYGDGVELRKNMPKA